MKEIKRVAAIHDLSCVGRCALSVVMPVISVMGHQAVPLPTALLSAHTGGFGDIYFKDLHGSMEPIARNWKQKGITFDAIYSGFLGSTGQIETVARFIEDFRESETLVLVDPVMGDDGRLYSVYNDEMKRKMRELCAFADIITPNLTEAFFLAGEEYRADTDAMDEDTLGRCIRGLAEKLEPLGAERVVITGIQIRGKVASACMDYGCGEYCICAFPRVDAGYPGAGDIFASVLLGMLLDGGRLADSVMAASKFVWEAARYTHENFPGNPVREGVALEGFLRQRYKI